MQTTEYPHKWECVSDKQNANIAALCEIHNTHIRLEYSPVNVNTNKAFIEEPKNI